MDYSECELNGLLSFKHCQTTLAEIASICGTEECNDNCPLSKICHHQHRLSKLVPKLTEFETLLINAFKAHYGDLALHRDDTGNLWMNNYTPIPQTLFSFLEPGESATLQQLSTL